MRHFRIPSLGLNTARLLGMFCLLFLTAEITLAQSNQTISINDITVAERNFGYEFTISLSAASSQTVTVLATTQAGTATSNGDFGAGSAVLDFKPGQTSTTLTVFIIDDSIVEGSETYFVNLSNPVNATIADGQGMGTIIDDETLMLLNQTNSTRGLALDSVFHTHESFPIVTDQALYTSDRRMRIVVFAIGLKLAAGEPSSAVTATAEDSVGTIRPLAVEFAGKVPGLNDWLMQVVLKLNDQIPTAGDIKVRVSLHGATSNAVLVAVTPQ